MMEEADDDLLPDEPCTVYTPDPEVMENNAQYLYDNIMEVSACLFSAR